MSKNTRSQPQDIIQLLEDLKADFNRRFDAQDARMMSLNSLLTQVTTKNQQLKTALEEKERQVLALERKMNNQEQYQRSWSIRILNLPIPADQDSSNTDVVMRTVFSKVLEPIFQGAVQKKLLPGIPAYTSILETAHILPSKPNQPPAIIARFFSGNIRQLVFRLKKEFATKVPTPTTSKSHPHPKLAHPFYEDLTTFNFSKMRAIAQDKRVLSCCPATGSTAKRRSGVFGTTMRPWMPSLPPPRLQSNHSQFSSQTIFYSGFLHTVTIRLFFTVLSYIFHIQ